MFNQRKITSLDDRFSEITKEQLAEFIGTHINGFVITDIEHDDRVRILRNYNPTDEEIQLWKERYLRIGKAFHPGDLLDISDSNDVLNEITAAVFDA